MNSIDGFRFDQRTQEILEHLTIPFAIYQYIDKRVVTIALSQGFCEEFGFKKLEDAYHVMDNDMYRATHPDDRTRVADAAYRFAALDEPYDIVYRTRTLKDPDYIILHAYGKSIYPEPGVRLCMTWYANEGHCSHEEGTYESILNQILSRFLTEESQYRGMYYDYMTGLPNMSYFYELAEASRKRMKEQGVNSVVLFFDLTGLKSYNRRYGFTEGNRLICDVASILATHFSSENCARFAQDYFAAFAPENGLTERLDAVITECEFANEGKTLPLRIGIYPDRIEEVDISIACDRAKLAADVRKKHRVSYYSYFDLTMLTDEKNRQEIIDNIDKAVEEGWIKVYYQSIIRSANSKVCNAEALARWDDPVRGLLSPASFIPVLEEAMLIHKLDLYIVKCVLQDLKYNKENGIRSVPISINFSRADFDACDLVEEISAMVDEAQIDQKLINIEITESIVGSDFDYMKEQIDRFREKGFQVWMDDFGSGYSSLDLLQSLPVDLIKFDMGFMRQFEVSEKSHIILTELMRMAQGLGMDTIAEGVETQKQVQFLREIGCSKLQGFYFSKPYSAHEFYEQYRKRKTIPAEDQQESEYYAIISKINLHDPMELTNKKNDNDLFFNLNVLPMAVLEWDGNHFTIVRCNRSFKEFLQRVYQVDYSDVDLHNTCLTIQPGKEFLAGAMRCIETDEWERIEGDLKGRVSIQSFIHKAAVNPKTGAIALTVMIFSIMDKK